MNKKGEWIVSPAFDMTYSFDPTGKWTKSHQINLNGKRDNFTRDDIISFGKYCNISEKKSIDILNKTLKAFEKFKELADKYNVPTDLKKTILSNLRLDI